MKRKGAVEVGDLRVKLVYKGNTTV